MKLLSEAGELFRIASDWNVRSKSALDRVPVCGRPSGRWNYVGDVAKTANVAAHAAVVTNTLFSKSSRYVERTVRCKQAHVGAGRRSNSHTSEMV